MQVFEKVLGMEVVQESGCGALVTVPEAGGGNGGSRGAEAHTDEEPRQAHHYDWYSKRLREHNKNAGDADQMTTPSKRHREHAMPESAPSKRRL